MENNLIKKYGETIDDDIFNVNISTPNSKIYDDFCNYFNNPIMIKSSNVNGYSKYMCKTYCLLSKECRYIVVFVSQDNNNKGDKVELQNLRWVSLQTRTLPNYPEYHSHSYQPKQKGPLNTIIKRINQTDESSEYSCDKYPISITLLNNNESNYKDNGNIIAALETYNTIICLT